MTKNQIGLVQDSWRMVSARDAAGSLLYDQLSALMPGLANEIAQQEGRQPAREITARVNYIVRNLHKSTAVINEIEDFSRRHVSCVLQDEAFICAGRSLLDIMATGLGENWNTEIEQAWLNCYVTVAEAIKNVSCSNENEPLYFC